MALQKALVSYTIEDAKGYKGSMPLYVQYDDAVATLASILATVDSLNTIVDNITEGMINSVSVVLYPTLGAGLKATPVANSDIEESGLFTFPLVSLPSKSFSIDVPALIQTAFVDDAINTAETNVAAFLDEVNSDTSDLIMKNDVWSSSLGVVRKARKSFRKFGKR